MATYSGPSVHVTAELVYTVPADWQFGSPWPEVEKAVVAMLNSLRELEVLKSDESPSDDLIRIKAGEGEIYVVATVNDFTSNKTSEALGLLGQLYHS